MVALPAPVAGVVLVLAPAPVPALVPVLVAVLVPLRPGAPDGEVEDLLAVRGHPLGAACRTLQVTAAVGGEPLAVTNVTAGRGEVLPPTLGRPAPLLAGTVAVAAGASGCRVLGAAGARGARRDALDRATGPLGALRPG